MNALELKIPPVALALLVAAAMWLAGRVAPSLAFDFPWRLVATVVLLVAGALAGLAGVAAFRAAGTTVNPTRPTATSSLVTSGIYRFTRNPMYLGLLLALAAWALFLANALAIILLPVFVATMNRLQIAPEERVMAAKFGPAFAAYTQSVRRWL